MEAKDGKGSQAWRESSDWESGKIGCKRDMAGKEWKRKVKRGRD